MAWTASGWHGSWLTLSGLSTGSSNHALGHAMRAALYDNTRTPDGRANLTGSSATTPGYANGQWAGGEVASAPGWPAGGRTIPGGLAAEPGAGQARVTGDPVFSDGPVTLTPFGDMIYDPEATIVTAPRLSLCFHYFGGPVPAVSGGFEILWAPDGIAVMMIPVTAPPGGP
jgi:hypothetical protein